MLYLNLFKYSECAISISIAQMQILIKDFSTIDNEQWIIDNYLSLKEALKISFCFVSITDTPSITRSKAHS